MVLDRRDCLKLKNREGCMKRWYVKTPFVILQGLERRCLDWRKAADIIKQNYRAGMIVYAGIKEDWKDTEGIIFENGQSVNTDAVVNAKKMNDQPILLIRYENGTSLKINCWKYSSELDYVGDKWPFKFLLKEKITDKNRKK